MSGQCAQAATHNVVPRDPSILSCGQYFLWWPPPAESGYSECKVHGLGADYARKAGVGEGDYELGSVVKSSDSQDRLDALLQPGQAQDGGKPALHWAQLLYVADPPVLRVLPLQVRQEYLSHELASKVSLKTLSLLKSK